MTIQEKILKSIDFQVHLSIAMLFLATIAQNNTAIL